MNLVDINLILLPLTGFVIGFLVTTIGGGGGIIFVPILTLFFNIPTQIAVSTSLASMIPTTLLGAISHNRQGNLNRPIGVILVIGGVIGSLIGVYISSLISSNLLERIFGVVLIILIIPMILSSRKRSKEPDTINEKIVTTSLKKFLVSLFGLLSGIMSGLFGLSGATPIVTGLYILGLPAVMVAGTSVFVLFFNSTSGLIGHLFVGQFNLLLIILLGGGGAIGAFVSPRVMKKIDNKTLEKIYGPVFVLSVIILGIAMILK